MLQVYKRVFFSIAKTIARRMPGNEAAFQDNGLLINQSTQLTVVLPYIGMHTGTMPK